MTTVVYPGSDPMGDGGPIVVHEERGHVDVIFGFLTVIFALALWRGHTGAETDSGRLVVDIVAGGLFLLSATGWLWFRRHPGRLEVGRDQITFRHRGQVKGRHLQRTGELDIHHVLMGGGPTRIPFLKVTGSDDAISLQFFNVEEVVRACRAKGWTFAQGS